MSEKRPWVNFPHIWKSESAFMTFLRGAIRQSVWNRYPIKLEFIKKNRKKIDNPNPKGRVAKVCGGTCYLCHKDFVQNDLQVDHIKGNFQLKKIEDRQSFVEGLTLLTTEDLAFVCKPCHTIKSYSERYSISFEEARLRKEVIKFSKESVENQLAILAEYGYTGSVVSNATKRKSLFEEVLNNG